MNDTCGSCKKPITCIDEIACYRHYVDEVTEELLKEAICRLCFYKMPREDEQKDVKP